MKYFLFYHPPNYYNGKVCRRKIIDAFRSFFKGKIFSFWLFAFVFSQLNFALFESFFGENTELLFGIKIDSELGDHSSDYKTSQVKKDKRKM